MTVSVSQIGVLFGKLSIKIESIKISGSAKANSIFSKVTEAAVRKIIEHKK